jgi:predicted TIM-barrel fold metal-dependent hydrolase
MTSHPVNRRRFLAGTDSALAAVPLAAAGNDSPAHRTTGIVDCQSQLFLPEVLDLMRKRKTEPLVYDQDGVAVLKMGDWLRKVPPPYTSVQAKLAAMDASGIEITLLSTNDPGPEWFGDDGPTVAQLIHDSLAGVIAKHPTRFRALCTLPLQNEKAAAAELDRCVKQLGFVGILLYTNLAGTWCDEPQFHWPGGARG